MQVLSTSTDQAAVIALSGAIEFSSRQTLRAVIDERLTHGCREVVFDLQEVTFIDSSGLGALVACFSTIRKQGGSLKLRRVPRPVYELMEITKLTDFFHISDHE